MGGADMSIDLTDIFKFEMKYLKVIFNHTKKTKQKVISKESVPLLSCKALLDTTAGLPGKGIIPP
jgi:hypothetical protein